MARFTGPQVASATVLALLGWWGVACPQPTHAATREVLAAAAVCAQMDGTAPEHETREQTRRARNPHHWNYSASRDGRGHWLWLTAESATVETPAGRLRPDRRSGRVQLTIVAACREGEAPLSIELTFPPHADQPRTTRTLSLRNLWWNLTGTTPEPERHETTVRLGTSPFETAFTREPVAYGSEQEYRAGLETASSTAELLRVGDTGTVRLTADGEMPIAAVFQVPTGYGERLRHMQEHCD